MGGCNPLRVVVFQFQVYEKKVSSLANFNIDSRNMQAGNAQVRVNALNTPRLMGLHMPKVRTVKLAFCTCGTL